MIQVTDSRLTVTSTFDFLTYDRSNVEVLTSGGAEVATIVEAQFVSALYRDHARVLRSFVAGLLGSDRGSADDVVQETFVRAWRHRLDLQQDPRSPRSWLFTVARRVVINQWRTDQRRPQLHSEAFVEAAVEDGTSAVDNREFIREGLRRLTPEHRQVLIECYLRDSRQDEVAARLGVPIGTVKSRLHYALYALRQELKSDEWESPSLPASVT